jgi:two-component system, cell cycle sensor histidine kinase and response regulator CckA
MEQSSQFLDVADWLPEPILLIERDGTLLAANRAAMRILGLPADLYRALRLTALHVGDESALEEFLAQASRAREPRLGTLTLRGAAGDALDFRAHCGVYKPAHDGLPTRLLMRLQSRSASAGAFQVLNERIEQLSKEIQRRRQAEADRKRLETQLLQAQKLESLGVLAGGIAHDFNNILTGVIGYCDLARLELQADSEAASFLGEAVNGARQAAELTQQLLAYSGKGKFAVASVRLTDLVTSTTRLLEISISKQCVLRLDLMADQPYCQADTSQMRQVIMNLIINASDAIGDRSGVIAVTTGAVWCEREYLATGFAAPELAEGLYATLEVSDTGVGMSAETQARIFDPFFTTKFTGRGLGLAAVMGIVRSHGGAIRVYSEVGKGTTFKLLLPALAAELPETVPVAPAPLGTRQHVIVADDEERIRALARHMLERLGYTVTLAADGRSAVSEYAERQEENPLVLLDLTMPHLDGPGALREIRSLRPDARVVLMSGYSEQAAMDKHLGRGVLGFLQKPFRMDDLARVVSNAFVTSEPDQRAD